MTQHADPKISCPQCKTEIKLTESLAAPLLAATRESYEKRMREQSLLLEREKQELQTQQSKLAHAQANLTQQIAERLEAERAALVAQEQKKARSAVDFEMKQQAVQFQELQQTLKAREAKLVEAQKQQAEFLAKERALEDQKRELELTIAKRTAEQAEAIRAKAVADAEQEMRLKVSEKEEQIAGMQRQIDELRRRSEQGSQQLQGEALELDFEQQLAARFPLDSVAPVPKGEIGADLLQHVNSANGQVIGTIIWELKRAKSWSEGWLAKLRDDQREITADVAILVSAVLPKGVETFALVDGVYVVHPRSALALAAMLRASLEELALVRVKTEGQATKMEQLYGYMTGARFKHRIEAIMENFHAEQEALDKEKKFMMRQWAKREQHLFQVLEATAGVYGDVQGIAGQAMGDIAALTQLGEGMVDDA